MNELLKQMSVYIKLEYYRLLKIMAAENDTTLQDLMEEAIIDFLKKKGKL